MELLRGCVDNITCYTDSRYAENIKALQELRNIGFDDDEIEQFGCGYLLDLEEEDDENY